MVDKIIETESAGVNEEGESLLPAVHTRVSVRQGQIESLTSVQQKLKAVARRNMFARVGQEMSIDLSLLVIDCLLGAVSLANAGDISVYLAPPVHTLGANIASYGLVIGGRVTMIVFAHTNTMMNDQMTLASIYESATRVTCQYAVSSITADGTLSDKTGFVDRAVPVHAIGGNGVLGTVATVDASAVDNVLSTLAADARNRANSYNAGNAFVLAGGNFVFACASLCTLLDSLGVFGGSVSNADVLVNSSGVVLCMGAFLALVKDYRITKSAGVVVVAGNQCIRSLETIIADTVEPAAVNGAHDVGAIEQAIASILEEHGGLIANGLSKKAQYSKECAQISLFLAFCIRYLEEAMRYPADGYPAMDLGILGSLARIGNVASGGLYRISVMAFYTLLIVKNMRVSELAIGDMLQGEAELLVANNDGHELHSLLGHPRLTMAEAVDLRRLLCEGNYDDLVSYLLDRRKVTLSTEKRNELEQKVSSSGQLGNKFLGLMGWALTSRGVCFAMDLIARYISTPMQTDALAFNSTDMGSMLGYNSSYGMNGSYAASSYNTTGSPEQDNGLSRNVYLGCAMLCSLLSIGFSLRTIVLTRQVSKAASVDNTKIINKVREEIARKVESDNAQDAVKDKKECTLQLTSDQADAISACIKARLEQKENTNNPPSFISRAWSNVVGFCTSSLGDSGLYIDGDAQPEQETPETCFTSCCVVGSSLPESYEMC